MANTSLETIALATLAMGALGALLAGALSVFERLLGRSGTQQLTVNEQEPIAAQAGATLLSELAANDIFLPSACGGRASCGLCKVRVVKGGGALLITERPLLDDEEQADGLRLSCQVKFRSDIAVEIPQSLLDAECIPLKVVDIEQVCHDTRRITLAPAKDKALKFTAGQYVQLEIPVHDGLLEPVQRAYSISSSPSRPERLELIIRRIPHGIATTFIHELLMEGDLLDVNGPHGDFFLQQTPKEAVFIAGGSGLAPFESILADMVERGIKKKVTFFFGAVRLLDLYDLDRMREYSEQLPGFTFIPALSSPEPDDEWDGETGLVTEVLKRHFDTLEGMEGYLCGSPGMVDACVRSMTGMGMDEGDIFYDEFG